MFERLLIITEQRANEADDILLSALEDFAPSFKDIFAEVAKLEPIPNEEEWHTKIEIIAQLVERIKTHKPKNKYDDLEALMSEIHNTKNAFSKLITDKTNDVGKKFADLGDQVLQMGKEFNPKTKAFDLGPIAKEASFLSKGESSYPPEVSAALHAKKAVEELKTAINQILSADKNLPLKTARKSFDAVVKTNLRFVNIETRNKIIPGKQKRNSALIKDYLQEYFPDIEAVITKYITIYIELTKLKESRSKLDNLDMGLVRKWQQVKESHNKYLTRDSLDKILKSRSNAEYHAAAHIKSMLKNELNLPFNLVKQVTALEKRLAALEADEVKPNSKLKKFQSESGVSAALILHTVKFNLESVQIAQLNALGQVMNRNYLKKLTDDPDATNNEFNTWIKTHSVNLTDTIEKATIWLNQIEEFIGVNSLKLPELPPLSVSPSHSRSSVSSLLGNFFSRSPSSTISSTPSANSSASTPVFHTPEPTRKSMFPSLFRSKTTTPVSKATNTMDEQKDSPLNHKRSATSQRLPKLDEKKDQQDTLPNIVNESKSPRRR